jgi:putative colanic acid biosynthesis UDP-glucose lipid carrier transferase
MANYKHHIRQHSTWSRLLYKAIDSVAIVVGLFLLVQWMPHLNSSATLMSGLVAIGIFALVAELVGLYRNWEAVAFEREATCSLVAWTFTLLALSALGSLSISATELSGQALLAWFTFTPLVALTGRIVLRWLMRWLVSAGIHARSFAVVGVNQLGIRLVRNIQASPDMALRFLGFFDDRPHDRTEPLPEDLAKHLGRLDDLVADAKQNKVDVIFITLPMRAEERTRQIIAQLSDTTASVYIVPDVFVFQLLHSRWTDIQGVPVVSVFENPFYGVDGILKRSVDLVVAFLILVIALVPMLLIALAIKLTSRGPVLFRQRRYGLDGREIFVWKFRTMRVVEDGPQIQQATRNDPRITRLGGLLRRTSLDELPQLFNVLTGTMSLVGPRPHATAHNEFYRQLIDGYMLRHKVKPGITGLAQVNGCRGETETLEKMQRRVEWDHCYIREWSFWLDLKIMFRTLTTVLSKQNAY